MACRREAWEVDRLGKESLSRDDQSASDHDAWRRATQACFEAALQVWSARCRRALSPETERELARLEDRLWTEIEACAKAKAAVQIRPEGR